MAESTWYSRSFPTVKNAHSIVRDIGKRVRDIQCAKEIYVWGSYADHHNDPGYRLKDIDLIVVADIHSEDLVAVTEDILSTKLDVLEDMGYDVDAVRFSKKFASIDEPILDRWAVSSDRRLLHWGPMISDREDSEAICNEARKYAKEETGVRQDRVGEASQSVRNNWYAAYKHHYMQHLQNMPSGWYVSDAQDVEDIISYAIKVDTDGNGSSGQDKG